MVTSFGRADRLRAAFPDPPALGSGIDMAVGGLEDAGWNAGRFVAVLFGDALYQPASSWKSSMNICACVLLFSPVIDGYSAASPGYFDPKIAVGCTGCTAPIGRTTWNS